MRYRVSDRPGLLVNELERGGRWVQRPARRYESHFRLTRPTRTLTPTTSARLAQRAGAVRSHRRVRASLALVEARALDFFRFCSSQRQRRSICSTLAEMAREYVGLFNPDLPGKFRADAVRSCWPGAPTDSPSPARDCRTAPCLPSPRHPPVPVSRQACARRAAERVGQAATLGSPPAAHWARMLRVVPPPERPPRARPPSWACATPLQVGAPFPQGFDRPRTGIPHWQAASVCAARDEVRNEVPRAVRLSAAQLLRAGCGMV